MDADFAVTIPAAVVRPVLYLLAFAVPAYLFPLLYKLFVPTAFPRVEVPMPPEARPEWDGDKTLEKNAPKKGGMSIVREGQPNLLFPFDPSTGHQLPPVQLTKPEELSAMVDAARKAQQEMMAMPKKGMDRRMLWLGIMERWEVDNGDAVGLISARGSGKTVIDAYYGEHLTNLSKLRYLRQNTERLLASEYRSTGPLTVHKSARVDYVPFGVLGAIVSWNYPIHNVVGVVSAAVASGNGMVVKVSEYAAFSLPFLRTLFEKTLEAAGLPKTLVQLCTGHADTGAALIPLVDKLTFIGSPGVGKAVMKTASATLTPVVLELGGKDAAVVFADADLAQVQNVIMRGVYQNAGQNCIGIERVLVEKPVYQAFVVEMEKRVKALRQSAPLGFGLGDEQADVGAMVLPASLGRIQELVDDAVKKGARLLVGGKRYEHPRWPKGQYYPPTLLADVTPEMRIAQEEVFGPVMVVMPFSGEDEAVALTNSTPFGLNGAVFTLDKAKGRRVMERIRTGMCNLNDFAVNYLCQSLPFGGVGLSGFDRFAGEEGVRGGCYTRAITEDWIPGVKTDIPPILNYPVKDETTRFMLKLTKMLYDTTWSGKIGGLTGLLGALMGRSKKDKKQQ